MIAILLSVIIYLVFSNSGIKQRYSKTEQGKRAVYGFYECGFKPKQQIKENLVLGDIYFFIFLLF